MDLLEAREPDSGAQHQLEPYSEPTASPGLECTSVAAELRQLAVEEARLGNIDLARRASQAARDEENAERHQGTIFWVCLVGGLGLVTLSGFMGIFHAPWQLAWSVGAIGLYLCLQATAGQSVAGRWLDALAKRMGGRRDD